MRKIVLIILGVLLLQGTSAAFTSTAGVSPANYLKLHSGVRAAGMGNAFIGVADDTGAVFWNPAGMTQVERAAITSAYTSWFSDMKYANLASVISAGGAAAGFAVNYFSYGSIAETDASNPYGTGKIFDPTDLDITGSFAKDLSPYVTLGAGLRLISRNLPAKSYCGYGIDLGLMNRFNDNLYLGLSARNLFSSIGGSAGPSNYGIGLAYKGRPLTLALDVNIPGDNDVLVCLGAEYNMSGIFFMRAGYNSRSETDAGGNLGAGLGLRLGNMDFDYAFAPYGELGQTHRFSVTLRP